MTTELATDIRTVGELVAVLSKLPANTRLEIEDLEYGPTDYIRVYEGTTKIYLESRSDQIVRYVWMNGEDTYIHYAATRFKQTLCKLANHQNHFGWTLPTTTFPTEVTCPWCLYNTGQRRTMRNYGGPGVLYGGNT